MRPLGFGKKKRHSKKHGKKHAKPPAKLLRICKKYRVKATKKVGGKRMYKSVATLKKLCLRKARALRKKLIKMHKKSMKTHKRRVTKKTHIKRRGGPSGEDEAVMSFGRRRARFGQPPLMKKEYSMMPFGNGRLPMFGMKVPGTMFGKRRATKKVSKSAAMKAFRSFYKRHCAARRSGFGNGGNPPLNASMGYEFCPNGMGGVLGFNSTGLFPSPCISQGSSAPVQMGSLPPPTRVSQGGFGVRRRDTRSRRARFGGFSDCAPGDVPCITKYFEKMAGDKNTPSRRRRRRRRGGDPEFGAPPSDKKRPSRRRRRGDPEFGAPPSDKKRPSRRRT